MGQIKTYAIPSLGLRMVRERTIRTTKESVNDSGDAAVVAFHAIGDRPVEHCIAIMLDGRNKVTSIVTLAQGGMHGATLAPRDVLRAVLVAHGAAFILAHNHPSGDPTPSEQDITTTRAISRACAAIGMPLLDHIVVTRSPMAHASLAEHC